MAPCPHVGTRGGDDCLDPSLIPNASSPLLSPDPGNLLLPWIRLRPGMGARGDRTPPRANCPTPDDPGEVGGHNAELPGPLLPPRTPTRPPKTEPGAAHPSHPGCLRAQTTHPQQDRGGLDMGDPPKPCHPLRLPQPPQDGDMRGGGIAHWTPFSSASPSLVFPWSSRALPGVPGRRGAQSGIGAKTSWFGAN